MEASSKCGRFWIILAIIFAVGPSIVFGGERSSSDSPDGAKFSDLIPSSLISYRSTTSPATPLEDEQQQPPLKLTKTKEEQVEKVSSGTDAPDDANKTITEAGQDPSLSEQPESAQSSLEELLLMVLRNLLRERLYQGNYGQRYLPRYRWSGEYDRHPDEEVHEIRNDIPDQPEKNSKVPSRKSNWKLPLSLSYPGSNFFDSFYHNVGWLSDWGNGTLFSSNYVGQEDSERSRRAKRSLLPNVAPNPEAVRAALLQRELLEHGGHSPFLNFKNFPVLHAVPEGFGLPASNHHLVDIRTNNHHVSHGTASLTPHHTVVHKQHHQVLPHHDGHFHKGYEVPSAGGSLEEVFGLSTKYHHPHHHGVHENYNHLQKPHYDKHPAIDYHDHPFSMEMVFGLPMHKYYMKKFGPTMFSGLEHHGHHPHHHHHHHAKKLIDHYDGEAYHPKPAAYQEPVHLPSGIPYHSPEQPVLAIHEHHPGTVLLHPSPAPPTYQLKELALHPTPIPAYHGPTAQPIAYKEPKPAYQEPKLTYQPPAALNTYDIPHLITSKTYPIPKNGGLLEEVFHLDTKYHHYNEPPLAYPKHKPITQDYLPAPADDYGSSYSSPSSVPPVYAADYSYDVPSSGYSLHYLPYEGYQPVHPETKAALKAGVPSSPEAAHILVPSPHPRLGFQHHQPHGPFLHLHPIKKRRSKRSTSTSVAGACQLPGGRLRGPGGIVVRPPDSHPVIQIHVGDDAKLPALAFYSVDSTINRRAVDAIKATSSGPTASNNAIYVEYASNPTANNNVGSNVAFDNQASFGSNQGVQSGLSGVPNPFFSSTTNSIISNTNPILNFPTYTTSNLPLTPPYPTVGSSTAPHLAEPTFQEQPHTLLGTSPAASSTAGDIFSSYIGGNGDTTLLITQDGQQQQSAPTNDHSRRENQQVVYTSNPFLRSSNTTAGFSAAINVVSSPQLGNSDIGGILQPDQQSQTFYGTNDDAFIIATADLNVQSELTTTDGHRTPNPFLSRHQGNHQKWQDDSQQQKLPQFQSVPLNFPVQSPGGSNFSPAITSQAEAVQISDAENSGGNFWFLQANGDETRFNSNPIRSQQRQQKPFRPSVQIPGPPVEQEDIVDPKLILSSPLSPQLEVFQRQRQETEAVESSSKPLEELFRSRPSGLDALSGHVLKDQVPDNKNNQPTQTLLQSLFSLSVAEDTLRTPKLGAWNFSPTKSSKGNERSELEALKEDVNAIRVQDPKTLKTTDLQNLFEQDLSNLAFRAPTNPWNVVPQTKTVPANHFLQPVDIPDVVNVLPQDLIFMMENIDPASLNTDEDASKKVLDSMRNINKAAASATRTKAVITVKTTDLQELFNNIKNQQVESEFSFPTSGVWKNFGLAESDLESIHDLKTQVSEMIKNHEERFDKKGFISTREKELLTKLKEKESALENIMGHLESSVGPDDPPWTTSHFKGSDFASPTSGTWNFKEAFRQLMQNKLSKSVSSKENSETHVASSKEHLLSQLVSALRASDFQPPTQGTWDFKSQVGSGHRPPIEVLDPAKGKNISAFPQVQDDGTGVNSGGLSVNKANNGIVREFPDYTEDIDDHKADKSHSTNVKLGHSGLIGQTKIINNSGNPQVVIIPHGVVSSNSSGKISVSVGQGTTVIGFEAITSSSPPRNLSLSPIRLSQEEPGNLSFSRTVQDLAVNIDQAGDDNEKRRQALLRASEKQELLLKNLLDAVARHRLKQQGNGSETEIKTLGDASQEIENDNQVEDIVEEAVNKQIVALKDLKNSVMEFQVVTGSDGNLDRAPAGITESLVRERLNLLEDAAHRQLEVLESLIDAVERLDNGSVEHGERLQKLEKIAEQQNAAIQEIQEASAMAVEPTSTNTASLPLLLPDSTPSTKVHANNEEVSPVGSGFTRDSIIRQLEQLRQKPQTQPSRSVGRLHHGKGRAESDSAILGFLLGQKRPSRKSTPDQPDLESLRLKAPFVAEGIREIFAHGQQEPSQPLISTQQPSSTAFDWHQRFMDNFRLQQLQNRARSLNAKSVVSHSTKPGE